MILALFALINFISIDRRLSIRLRVRKGEATVKAAIRWRKRRLYILVDTGSSVSVCFIIFLHAVHILTFFFFQGFAGRPCHETNFTQDQRAWIPAWRSTSPVQFLDPLQHCGDSGPLLELSYADGVEISGRYFNCPGLRLGGLASLDDSFLWGVADEISMYGKDQGSRPPAGILGS